MSSSTPKRRKLATPVAADRAAYDRDYKRRKKAGLTGTRRRRAPLDTKPPRHKRRPVTEAPAYKMRQEQPDDDCILRIPTARVFVPLLEPARYKGARGGRGSGKSHFFAERMIARCVADPNTRAVCVREFLASIKKSVKLLIADKIKSMGVSSRFDVQKTEIHVLDEDGERCGRIDFQGMQDHTADSIKSLEAYDICWVEEAQSLSEHSWGLLRPTIRKEGSEIWCSWNPRSPKDPVDKFFMENKDGRRVVLVDAQYFDNPWFPTALQEEMERDRERDNDRFLHVWCGNYQKHSQARVFRNWRIGSDKDFPSHLRKLTPRYGADWGFANDPTVAVKCYIDEDAKKLYVVAEAYKIGCEIVDTPALFDDLDECAMRKYPCRADSARPETISHMKKHGYPLMMPAVKGKNSVEEGVKFLQSFDIIVHEDCVHCIDELTFYSWKVDKHTEEVTNELDDKKNHVIDAIRYAAESVRNRSRIGVLF
ncbi:MAG: PBSX family phage terminase large subunit [Phycisphaerales bacterium]